MSTDRSGSLVANTLVGLFFTVLIAVQSWTCIKILAHDNWIAAASSNRYTIQMAIEHEKEVAVKYEYLQGQLSDIQVAIAKLPDSLPPAWFLKDYTEFKQRVNAHIDAQRGGT